MSDGQALRTFFYCTGERSRSQFAAISLEVRGSVPSRLLQQRPVPRQCVQGMQRDVGRPPLKVPGPILAGQLLFMLY